MSNKKRSSKNEKSTWDGIDLWKVALKY